MSPPTLDTLKVYVVEDSPLIRRRLIAALSALPEVVIVGEATDAHPAVAGILALRPDVVCLDLQLAHSNGVEVLEHIRFLKPPPLVMVLTNHSSPPYRQICLRAGAHLFFDKATEFDLFLAAIEKLLVAPLTPTCGNLSGENHE